MDEEVYVDINAFEMVKKRKKYLKIFYICLAFLIFGYLASNYIIIQDRTLGINDTSSLSAGALEYGWDKINKGPMYDVKINLSGTIVSGKITICYVKELEGRKSISEISKDNIIEALVIDKPGEYDITVELGDLPDEYIYNYIEVSDDFVGSSITSELYIYRPLIQLITNIIMTNIFGR